MRRSSLSLSNDFLALLKGKEHSNIPSSDSPEVSREASIESHGAFHL